MRNRTFILTILLLVASSGILFAQKRISGFVKDAQTGERLIGASVVEPGTTNGTSTDHNGYFSMVLGSQTLSVSFIGYQTKQVAVPQGDKLPVLNIELLAGTELDEVQVVTKALPRFNTGKLNYMEMLNIPALGGKPDVLKALQLIPGIQSQQEGTSLLMVRGGSPGENLYLIDNVPLIYVNHLGGFTSVFNPDMINDIEVYKNAFPARYGGKLSSVISMSQREGNRSARKGSLSVGVTDASFSAEGPLKAHNGSYMVTGRKTLIDPLMILASGLSGGGDYYFFYGFHDLNGKFSWRPNTRNSYAINLYQGDDYMKYWMIDKGDHSNLNTVWGNWLASARWSHVVSPQLFVDNTLSYTRYRSKVEQNFTSKSGTQVEKVENEYRSTVADVSLRNDWKWQAAQNWAVDFGAKLTYNRHMPNEVEQSHSEVAATNEVVHSTDMAVYASNNIKWGNKLEADLGVRAVRYGSNGFSHLALEPRVLIDFKLNRNHTLNFSFQQVNQFAHLVLTPGAILVSEIWIPSDQRIAPGQSIQYSAGWMGRFYDGLFEAEVNAYYKELSNLSTYREGYSNLLGDGNWRTKIESGGNGLSQGVEVLARKTQGTWTGFASYTRSETTRQFPGINQGQTFAYDYNRPHTASLFVNRKLSAKWDFSATWVYQTGVPYTPVVGRHLDFEGSEVLLFGERNSAERSAYHRMDVALNYTKLNKKNRKVVWNFSIYNLYNRHNASAYYYGTDSRQGVNDPYANTRYAQQKMYQVSMFPIIPTISFKVFFDAEGRPAREKKEKTSFKQKFINYLQYE
jgi:hypothetical protein